MSLRLKLVFFVKKLKLVQNPLQNCSVPRNWRQNTLRNCRFVLDWRLLLRRYNLSKTPCAPVMLLEIGRLTEGLWERGLATFNLPKLVCVVNNILEIRFAVLDRTCKKQGSQPYCCSKLASNHSGQLLFCFQLARIVRNVKLV